MVVICQKCGDSGFSRALIYCYKCQIAAEHRYCLYKKPKTFTEYVIWYCEDCLPEVTKSTAGKSSTASTKSVCLESKSQQVSQSIIDKNLKKKAVSGLETTTKLSRREKNSQSTIKLKERAINISMTKIQVSESENSFSSQSIKQLQGENLETDQELILYDESSNNGEAISNKRSTFEMVGGDPSDMFEQNLVDPSQPIYEPVWKGSFAINDDKFSSVDGMAAHLSTKASILVYKEAKLLPESLCPDLLPKSDVWPKGFQRSGGPRDDSIGLYFFPRNEREERVYDSLVEYMIEEDLAMRAVAANAELLVFTSKQLPLNYWRFQSKYYLWGVFRGKDTPPSQPKDRVLVSCCSNKSAVFCHDMDAVEERVTGILEDRVVIDLTKTWS